MPANFPIPSQSDGMRVESSCPLCSQEYDHMSLAVLAEKEEAKLVHITCPNCHTSIIALVVGRGTNHSSIGMVTDLKPYEYQIIHKRTALSNEDVYEIYEEVGSAELTKQLVKAYGSTENRS